MFKSLPVARDVYRHEVLPSSVKTYSRDTITLGWEERLRARGRRRSDSGLEFGTILARGSVLRADDCFVLDEAAAIIAVVEREEPVFVVRPATPAEWALFAYHIGNSHQPLMIAEDGLVCPDAPGMDQVLRYHGIPFVRAARSFTPVGLGQVYASHRHQP
jgi:urease accessory protein UreE